MSFCWSPEVLRVARRLYLDEGLSASESAKRIGTTRSALIAKAHRMGWAAERDPGLATANQVRGGRMVARMLRPARPPRAAAPKPDTVPCLPKPWLKRLAGECAYPVGGEGEDLLSCCRPSGRETYCAEHTAAMYLRRTDAQKAALERIAQWVERLERARPGRTAAPEGLR